MNRNIIIIIVAALVAFGAVLLIPRLLDSSSDDGEEQVAEAPEDDNRDGDSGSARSNTDDGDEQTADAGDKPDGPSANSGGSNPRPANPALAAQLQAAARQVNAGGPVRIDELTTMASASAQGNRIRYRYQVSRTLSSDQVASFRQFASTQNPQTICGRDITRQLIEMGGEIEYAYFGPGNAFLFSTPIVDC